MLLPMTLPITRTTLSGGGSRDRSTGGRICYDWLFPETLQSFQRGRSAGAGEQYMDLGVQPSNGLVDPLQPRSGGRKYGLRGGLQPRCFLGGYRLSLGQVVQ